MTGRNRVAGSLRVCLLCAVMVVALTACAAPPAALPQTPATAAAAVSKPAEEVQTGNVLAGTEWQLESMLDGAAAVKVLPGTAPSLAFGPDRHVGFGSCDWFVGLHILTGADGIQMQGPQKTMGGCPTEMGLQEQQGTYMQLLLDATRYAVEEGKLVMYMGDGQKALTMTPLKALPFEGTTWEFALYYSPQTTILTPGVPGTTITARFENGKLAGSAGCNDYSATYEKSDAVLKIGPIAATEKACADPQGVMEQETAYLSKLESVGQILQLPRTILLSASDGQPLLLYHAAPAAAGG